jgi:hypothetical protein
MSEEFERDYREDVKINRFKLELECSDHSSVYLYWSEQLTEYKAKLDEIKTRMDYKGAEVELELRKNPPEGLKVTESAIMAMIKTNKEINNLAQEFNEARKALNLLSAAVVSLEHRKSMLENLRHLFIAGYYSRAGDGTPKQSGSDQAEDTMRTGLNKGE